MDETERAVEEMDQTRTPQRIAAATVTVGTTIPLAYFIRTCELGSTALITKLNEPNIGVVKAYHKIWEENRHIDVVCYIHDDVEIFEEDWAEAVYSRFEDHPKLAILGLGGATGIGHPDIYKVPYEITQLARTDYASNQRFWEIHGSHWAAGRRVAVVDGFFMAVRTEFLNQIGGWDWINSNFHCYDLALCLMALRRGWEVMMLGIDCDHHGGGTSTKAEYVEWCREHGTTPEREHIEPHRWLYDEFRDLLPVRI